jgi:GntR family transcriptional regulator/MocR family aminotransferase
VLENDYDAEFRYGSGPLPTLAAIEGLEHVTYLGTFSKVLSPSIRLGFMVARRDLVDRIAATIADARDPVSTVIQNIVCWLIRTGELERHIRRARWQYAARRAAMLDALARLPAVTKVSGQAAGLHVVVTLERRAAASLTRSRLCEKGVVVDRVADFCVRPSVDDRLLLAYGHLTEAAIAQGVSRIENLICG